MRWPQITYALLLLSLTAYPCRSTAQTEPSPTPNPSLYSLRVSVDEVILTFHASDLHGLPINDLKLSEISLLDNDKPPRRIIDFRSLNNRPLRAGILMDISASMGEYLPGNRAISTKYIQRLLRQDTDQAFVMNFASLSQIAQPWTNDPYALTSGLRSSTEVGSRTHGTAIFDALYQACLNQFGHIDHIASGNFILLFSDGEDNTSHASLQQVADKCRQSNTAIYAFRLKLISRFSPGDNTLSDLASKTGGRVFKADDTEAGIYDDLRTIEADLRNQYRLIYRPAQLNRDGSFHHVYLLPSKRVDQITASSGYYAPMP